MGSCVSATYPNVLLFIKSTHSLKSLFLAGILKVIYSVDEIYPLKNFFADCEVKFENIPHAKAPSLLSV